MRILIFAIVVMFGFAMGSAALAPAAPSDCRFLTGSNGNVAFCDSFDSPSDGSTRAGELNGVIWGASRVTGNMNMGGLYSAWEPTNVVGCPGPNPALSTDDIRVCNGQLVEATTDAHSKTSLAMYPKQPMDIAGRTGTAVFDVGNDSMGTHAAWPEFWFTDQPVPAPYLGTTPRNGFGVSLADGCVDHVIIASNYVDTTVNYPGFLACTNLGSPTAMNHYEIKFSTSQLDVWGSDGGSSVMKHLASYPWTITLTRGLIWIEDAHYNGSKACDGKPIPPCQLQHEHTFAWDNVGFDGPFTYRDLSYDVLDNNEPAGTTECPTCRSIGWRSLSELDTPTLQTLPIPAGVSGQAARLMFTYYMYDPPVQNFAFSINGHQHSSPVPAAFATQGFAQRTLAIDIPTSDIVVGPQSIKLWGDTALLFANVNIVLVDTGGTPPPTPTPSPSPTLTPTVVLPTPTSSPPPPTATPSGVRHQCTLRWGANTIETYGNLTQQECANRGQ